jgi:hypothetical protein
LLTPLLLLALTAAQAPPPSAEGETTVEVVRVPPSVMDDDLIRAIGVPPDRTAPGPLEYVLVEGALIVFSGLAARYPEGMGWAFVGLSPLPFMNLQGGDTVEAVSVFAVGMAGIGLYNALELRGGGYSAGKRFLLNVAAWNAVAIGTEITARVTRGADPKPDAHSVSLGFGASGGRPVLVLGGRF